MLKTRIIPVMLWNGGSLVKGLQFDHSRNVGTVLPSIKVHNSRDVDELVLLDVGATVGRAGPRLSEIEAFTRECSVPLAVGGGISNEHHVEELLRVGADKVVVNSSSYSNPEIVYQTSRRFGSQCVVAGVDYWMVEGVPTCFSHAGKVMQPWSVMDWVRRLEDLGAGEILLTDCSRDGMMSGFDLQTIRNVVNSVRVPVIAAGGAGALQHFLEVLTESEADAVAAGSVFHFTEITPKRIRGFLAQNGIPVRVGHLQ